MGGRPSRETLPMPAGQICQSGMEACMERLPNLWHRSGCSNSPCRKMLIRVLLILCRFSSLSLGAGQAPSLANWLVFFLAAACGFDRCQHLLCLPWRLAPDGVGGIAFPAMALLYFASE